LGDRILKDSDGGFYFSAEENVEYFSGVSRIFSVRITSLNIKHQFRFYPYFTGNEDYNKNSNFILDGEGKLQFDSEVVVIGSWDYSSENFHVNFINIDQKIEDDTFISDNKSKKPIEGRYTAVMGLFERDSEVSNHDGWCIKLYVTKELLENLSGCVKTNSFDSLEVRIRFESLYIHNYDRDTPPSLGITWFLPPNEEASPSISRAAEGYIESFIISEKSIKNNDENSSASDKDSESQVVLKGIYDLIVKIKKDLFERLSGISFLLLALILIILIFKH
jgi:hypothetical protein